MIDTDKYEGHTSDWKWIDINEQDDFYLHSEYGDIINHDTPDGKLAQDAPLLLAEVKRLREEFGSYIDLWNICIELYDGDIELHRFKDWLDERSGGYLYPMKHKEESE